jgi:hypothetical protein
MDEFERCMTLLQSQLLELITLSTLVLKQLEKQHYISKGKCNPQRNQINPQQRQKRPAKLSHLLLNLLQEPPHAFLQFIRMTRELASLRTRSCTRIVLRMREGFGFCGLVGLLMDGVCVATPDRLGWLLALILVL